MINITSDYLKNTYYLEEKHLEEHLILFRFSTIEEIRNKINSLFKDSDLKVKDFDFKNYYDSDFQDYELMIILGAEKEDIVDLTIYYTISRIGAKVISEISYEII